MRIGEVARRVGCSPDLIRLWERKGMLPAAPRDMNGQRRYSEEDVQRCRALLLGDRPRGEGTRKSEHEQQ